MWTSVLKVWAPVGVTLSVWTCLEVTAASARVALSTDMTVAPV